MVRAALDVVFAPEPDTWATWVTSNRLADVAEAAPAPGQALVVECDEETFSLSPWRERTAELLQRAHGSGGHGILVVSTSRVPDEALYRCLPRLWAPPAVLVIAAPYPKELEEKRPPIRPLARGTVFHTGDHLRGV